MLLLGALNQAWATCPLNLYTPKITPKPLAYQGRGAITFTIYEDAGEVVPAYDAYGEPTCVINIDLSYLELQDHDKINVEGGILEYFSVEYTIDKSTHKNRIRLEQKATIEAEKIMPVVIAVDVTRESTSEEKFNGFQLNVIGSNVEGSEFTYTVN